MFVYTYEVNWLRDLSANHNYDEENQYPTHFTYNFLNNGSNSNGSFVYDGWKILKQIGCPNIQTYGGLSVNNDPTFWMTGFEKYESALHNKVEYYETIDLHDPEQALADLKQWLFNHNNDNEIYGGLASFMTNMPACDIMIIEAPLPEYGKAFLNEYNNPQGMNHQLTIVGYNDNICLWDINNDGVYTNDVDVDNDGDIDFFDYERGAFKVANSWDEGWPNINSGGYIYWPYKFLAYGSSPDHSDPFIANMAFIVYPKVNNDPGLIIRAHLYHEDRNSIRFDVDFGIDALDNTPETGNGSYYAFSFKGGDYPMLGNGNYDLFEVSLDYSYFFANEDVGKVYFDVWQGVNDNTLGYLSGFSLVDFRWGETFELDAGITNETLEYMYNWFSIDYDLIVPGDNQAINQDVILYSNMISRFNPTLTNNSTMTVENGVEIDMYNSKLIVSQGSNLIIEDNAIITGKNGTNEIVIDGNIQIGNNVTFENVKIRLNNPNQQAYFGNVDFDETILYNQGQNLNISNCTFFNYSAIQSYCGDITIDGTNFYNTWLYFDNLFMAPGQKLSMLNCNINNSNSYAGMEIWNYGEYHIEGSEIQAQNGGILIFNSGFGNMGNQKITDNEIHNCGSAGIIAYNTLGSIEGNDIHNNTSGLRILNNSNIALIGDVNALTYQETQQISDNIGYELYISANSFPWYFKYNVIVDEDNQGNSGTPADPLLYYDNMRTQMKDVRYNCWGNNFDPVEDLFPYQYLEYNPSWCPPGTTVLSGIVEELYLEGCNQYENEDYLQAKATFLLLIDQYPNSKYAEAAMKDLISLEQFTGNDYAALQNYFLNNDSIQNDSILKELSFFLSNRCDIKLENWPDAITYYENIINNSENTEDSIFAIIDLGYVYFLMENNGYKATYTGQLAQYKPQSKEQFIDYRNYLLSLIPKESANNDWANENTITKTGELIQNVPNPFSTKTQIRYKLQIQADVTLSVYNHMGQLVDSQHLGVKEEGEHKLEFNGSNFQAGIYYYSLCVNGTVSDSKKMILLK